MLRLGIPLKMTVTMMVELERREASRKPNSDLPKPLTIGWE
jgi:hypothetical protein